MWRTKYSFYNFLLTIRGAFTDLGFVHFVHFKNSLLLILSICYNVLFLNNSKVGIGYEKALRSQSKVPFFLGFKTKQNPNSRRNLGL